MDLVITGMSLSLQRIPSTSYYVESLMVNRDDPPVMVEHPGEVILQAIKHSSAQNHSSLLILHTEALPEYGFYTNRLHSLFGSVEHKKAPSTALIDILDLVKDQLEKDPDLLIVISETTGSGTAAIALSSHKFTEEGQARLVFPISDANLDSSFELAGFLGDLEEEGINHLETLITKRSSGRPVTLSQPDSYRQPSESILSLIHLTLAIKSKVLPSWTPPEDLVPGIETKSSLVCNGQPLPWLSTGQHFKRSAALVGQSLSTDNWHSVLIIDIPEPVEFQERRHIQGVDPYLFLFCGENQRELIAKLDQLESALEKRNSLSELAQNAYAQYSTGNPKYTCCLLAISRESLKHEVQHAKNGIPTAFSSQKHWTSPSGSYFTPLPFMTSESPSFIRVRLTPIQAWDSNYSSPSPAFRMPLWKSSLISANLWLKI